MVVLVCAEARVADALPSAMEVTASEEDCVADVADRSESGYGTTTTGATAMSTAPATSAGTGSPSDSGSGSDERDVSTARVARTDQDSTFLLEKDVLDMLKLSYILQATSLRHGDLQSLSQPTQELWSSLRESLMRRPPFANCGGKHSGAAGTDAAGRRTVVKTPSASLLLPSSDTFSAESKKDANSSRACGTGDALRAVLADLAAEGLLQSLLPMLLVPKSDAVDAGCNLQMHPAHRDRASAQRPASRGPEAARPPAEAVARTALAAEHQLQRHINFHEDQGFDPAMRGREVTIHVCDDSRDEKRDFVCRQDILLSQMGYFRDVTAGQSLEDVDISVHCDISVFEWLMTWIRSVEACDEADQPQPALDAANVVSILVSASFLKMGPLVELALRFAYRNMNKILATTNNLNCLGEPLLTRLGNLFKPSEVEDLSDRRDRIHSKLYMKLILALCEPQPQPDREIFHTLSTLYRCRLCGMLLTQHLSKLLPCMPLRSKINKRGEIVPKHQRDVMFNLNDFIRNLRGELKCWRRVFWRLWGIGHALYCSLCSAYFPAYLHEFCSFHPQDAEFPAIKFKNSTEPFGAYPCCQKQIYRYQTVPQRMQGCQSRDHRTKLHGESDSAIYKILMAHRDLICLAPARGKSGIKLNPDASSITLPKPMSMQGPLMIVVEDEQSAQDLSLVPKTRRRSLLNRSAFEIVTRPSTPVITAPLRRNMTAAASLTSATSAKLLATRWKNMAYGRLRRAPKMPSKLKQSSESSSAAEDASEDSSAGEDEDDDGAEEAGLEFEMDSKELCVEIKPAKDSAADKGKNLLSVAGHAPLSKSASAPGTCAEAGLGGEAAAAHSANGWMRWDTERSTRSNQDNQRELESCIVRELVKYLGRSQPGLTLGLSLTNRSWLNVQMSGVGGAFLRLEQDWRETHMAYLQHKSTRSSTLGAASASSSALSAMASSGAAVATLGTPAGRASAGRPTSATSMRSNRTVRR